MSEPIELPVTAQNSRLFIFLPVLEPQAGLVLLFVLFRVISWIVFFAVIKAIHEITRNNTKNDTYIFSASVGIGGFPSAPTFHTEPPENQPCRLRITSPVLLRHSHRSTQV